MLSTVILKYNVVVIINVIFIAFSDCDYELKRFKINYKQTSSIFITLKHRFLKEKDNVISVFYIFNKADIFLTLYFFNIIRLNLA